MARPRQVLDIAAWGYWALFTVQIAVQLPDGDNLINPDVIRPGWILTLPAVAAAPARTSDAPSPVASAPPAQVLSPNQIPAPQQLRQATRAPFTSSTTSVPKPSVTTITPAHQAPSVVRRPVAVHLPTGGYVSTIHKPKSPCGCASTNEITFTRRGEQSQALVAVRCSLMSSKERTRARRSWMGVYSISSSAPVSAASCARRRATFSGAPTACHVR